MRVAPANPNFPVVLHFPQQASQSAATAVAAGVLAVWPRPRHLVQAVRAVSGLCMRSQAPALVMAAGAAAAPFRPIRPVRLSMVAAQVGGAAPPLRPLRA